MKNSSIILLLFAVYLIMKICKSKNNENFENYANELLKCQKCLNQISCEEYKNFMDSISDLSSNRKTEEKINIINDICKDNCYKVKRPDKVVGSPSNYEEVSDLENLISVQEVKCNKN